MSRLGTSNFITSPPGWYDIFAACATNRHRRMAPRRAVRYKLSSTELPSYAILYLNTWTSDMNFLVLKEPFIFSQSEGALESRLPPCAVVCSSWRNEAIVRFLKNTFSMCLLVCYCSAVLFLLVVSSMPPLPARAWWPLTVVNHMKLQRLLPVCLMKSAKTKFF